MQPSPYISALPQLEDVEAQLARNPTAATLVPQATFEFIKRSAPAFVAGNSALLMAHHVVGSAFHDVLSRLEHLDLHGAMQVVHSLDTSQTT